MRHPEHDFHVVEEEIQIDFEVPLAAEGADDVLVELLSYHALEIVNDRIHRGQPIDGIPTARISAKRLGESVEIATIDLGEPEEVVEIDMPMLIPWGSGTGYDPLSRYGDAEETNVLALAENRASDDLAPIGDDLRLTAGIAAGLRAMGIDPETMSVTELGRGLLQLAGYVIADRDENSLIASGKGTSTFVRFLDHTPGDYPELSHQAIAAFLVACARARTERGLLITDKFGPYEIYKKERANPDIRFVTRERLQGFVDSVALSS